MNEIAALLTSFTHLQNIAQALLSLRDFEKLNAKVIELQSAIITAQQQTIAIQQSHALLDAKAHELEAECVRLKDWSAEAQKYVRREIATGVFAFVENGIVGNLQRAHKFCCNCFDHGEKSLLQQVSHMLSGIKVSCPRCKFEVLFQHYL